MNRIPPEEADTAGPYSLSRVRPLNNLELSYSEMQVEAALLADLQAELEAMYQLLGLTPEDGPKVEGKSESPLIQALKLAGPRPPQGLPVNSVFTAPTSVGFSALKQ